MKNAKKRSCNYPHSQVEFKFWKHAKLFHKSLSDLCDFEEIHLQHCETNFRDLLHFVNLLIATKKNDDDLIEYFNIFEEFYHFFSETYNLNYEGFKMSCFLQVAERYQNYEFTAYMYDKFFKDACFDYPFDAEKDVEIIRYIIQQLETTDYGISENFMIDYEDHFFNPENPCATELENDSSTKLKFLDCLKENVCVDFL